MNVNLNDYLKNIWAKGENKGEKEVSNRGRIGNR